MRVGLCKLYLNLQGIMARNTEKVEWFKHWHNFLKEDNNILVVSLEITFEMQYSISTHDHERKNNQRKKIFLGNAEMGYEHITSSSI